MVYNHWLNLILFNVAIAPDIPHYVNYEVQLEAFYLPRSELCVSGYPAVAGGRTNLLQHNGRLRPLRGYI